jgi:transcriptional regulator with XRE-family HTH domain
LETFVFMRRKQPTIMIESEIGKRIKALRNEKGLTLEQLAAQTGYTKGYLSKVEKSIKAPPVSTLGTIGRTLGVTISTLLGEHSPATSACCLVKKGERLLLARGTEAFRYSYEAVAHKFNNKVMEPFILTLPIHPKNSARYQHEGQELLYVLEGTMRFHHGTEEFIVEEGDCIYFDANVPHFGQTKGEKAAKCFMVICAPGSK